MKTFIGTLVVSFGLPVLAQPEEVATEPEAVPVEEATSSEEVTPAEEATPGADAAVEEPAVEAPDAASEEASKAAAEKVAAAAALEPIDYALADPDRGWMNYLLAVPAVATVNVLYWTPSKLGGKEYAQISLDTMKANLGHGLVFDEDGFATNQVGHPYQGNNYFNAARLTGLSFWESAPYVAGGSLMWEYLMESGPACCYPSTNDFVTTTVGGISLGEMLWRLSNNVLDDSTSGKERFGREFAALALNPPYGLFRLMSGEAWAVGPASVRHPVATRATFGMNFLSHTDSARNRALAGRIEVEYGDIGELSEDFEPFDYFTLLFGIVYADKKFAGARIDMAGLTNGWKLDLFGGTSNAVIGTAFDFDFFQSRLLKLGTSAFGLGFFTDTPVGERLAVHTKLIVAPAYGAISSDYPDIREYNFGPGAKLKLEGALVHDRLGRLYAKVYRYWLASTSGQEGHEMAGLIEVGGTVQVTESFGLGTRVYFIDKEGFYDDHENTRDSTTAIEMLASWKL